MLILLVLLSCERLLQQPLSKLIDVLTKRLGFVLLSLISFRWCVDFIYGLSDDECLLLLLLLSNCLLHDVAELLLKLIFFLC